MAITNFLTRRCQGRLSSDPRWLDVLPNALGHQAYIVEATRDGKTVGVLPLMFLSSKLFNRYLVSLPYVNGGGVVAEDDDIAHRLIDRAVELADQLNVRFLELRHQTNNWHSLLREPDEQKVLMHLSLPTSTDAMWKQLKSKVRSQIRKSQENELTLDWGSLELLPEFYHVFSRNMRDLGTPVFSRRLFHNILSRFADDAEICLVRKNHQAIAAAILVHGDMITEVPSASSLRTFNKTNANMLMYWHLICRSIERGQAIFDFGRSTVGAGTYRFKKQWGAIPTPLSWQFYLRSGSLDQMRPSNAKFENLIKIWKKMPVMVTRIVGPTIVRSIP